MADNEEKDPVASSTDDDDDSTSSSSSSSSDDDDEQAEEDSDDDLSSSESKLTPKQAYAAWEKKRKTLGQRLLQLRDELKAQPQSDIEVKKRLLTEIKNLREKWIAVQTRLTNLKARLSHSPTPERETLPPSKKPVPSAPKIETPAEPEKRVIPPPRVRTSSNYSSDRSRSSSRSREPRRPTEKPYRDLDALDDDDNNKTDDDDDQEKRPIITQPISSRPTTSYRDLTDDFSLSPSPSPSPSPTHPADSISFSNLGLRSLVEPKLADNADEQGEEEVFRPTPKETFSNQKIPYPIVNDRRDLDVINRQLKNQLREFEASRNNPLFNQPSNLLIYERLQKQNDYINSRMRIERLKRTKAKTQREREQNKKQFHHLLQEFRKLQRFMRAANRQSFDDQLAMPGTDSGPSSIPMPPSPEAVPRRNVPEFPPLDLHRVTGKKIIFESSDSDDDDDDKEPSIDPQVPVSESISEPRTVPDQINASLATTLPMPSNSTSSAALDAIKTRVANLINPTPAASSTQVQQTSSTSQVKEEGADDDDDDDNDDDQPPVNQLEKVPPISAKFNRKRRKVRRNKNKKKQNANQAAQAAANENDSTLIDQEEAWKRHIAMQLQLKYLKPTNPVSRALIAEAQKKLGISQEDASGLTFDGDITDFEMGWILQQQQEFLAAAAANPFNVLHNAAAGSSSSRPNLVDVLSNLNGGILPSSSEPQTPMGLLQKFFLDANNNANASHRSNFGLNDLSTTPPTPPTPRDISIGKKIVESLTHHDINALLKLSGSEHDDDDDDDDDENNNHSMEDDTDDEINQFSFDEDSNDVPNGANKNYDRWERPSQIPSRSTQGSSLANKKSAMETLILPSFNRCTHLGKSTKRSAGLERMFPSFSKHNAGPSSTLSLILYGLSTAP